MNLADTLTIAVALAALSLSAWNFVHTRRVDARDVAIQADELLSDARDLLWSEEGWANTKKPEKREEARSKLERASMIAGPSLGVVMCQGWICEAHGDLEGARRCYEQVANSRKSNLKRSGLFSLGKIASGEESIQYFEHAAACDRSKAMYSFYAIANVHQRAGRYDEAAVYLNKCKAAAGGTDADASVDLGNLCELQGKPADEARAHYHDALEADDEHVRAMCDLGLLRSKEDDGWKDAMWWTGHAIDIAPKSPLPHKYLAAMHLDRNMPEIAEENANRAATLDPKQRLQGKLVYEMLEEAERLLTREAPQEEGRGELLQPEARTL